MDGQTDGHHRCVKALLAVALLADDRLHDVDAGNCTLAVIRWRCSHLDSNAGCITVVCSLHTTACSLHASVVGTRHYACNEKYRPNLTFAILFVFELWTDGQTDRAKRLTQSHNVRTA